MKPLGTVVLDNEAVQVLASVDHSKHRRVIAVVDELVARKERGVDTAQLVVPTAVRVEAGWDRQSPVSAKLNRLRIRDAVLDATAANAAARVRSALEVSVADAHLAAILQNTPGPHAVMTSDVDDAQRMADHLGLTVNVVRI